MLYSLEKLDQLLYTNFAIVGPYKTGKTESLASLHKLKSRKWVKGKRLYIHDFDEGCQPVIRVAKREGWTDELRIFRYPKASGDQIGVGHQPARSKESFLDFLTAINSLYDHVMPNGTDWRPDFLEEAPYALVIDSCTSLADDILDFCLTNRGKELGNSGVDGRQEFGFQMAKIVEVVKSTRSLPCFTVWLFHEQVKAETVKTPTAPKGAEPIAPQLTGKNTTLPLVTGQLASSIGGYFGAVLFTKVEPETSTKSKYQWVTRPDGNTIRGAGTRLKEGLPELINQDFDLIVDQ